MGRRFGQTRLSWRCGGLRGYASFDLLQRRCRNITASYMQRQFDNLTLLHNTEISLMRRCTASLTVDAPSGIKQMHLLQSLSCKMTAKDSQVVAY